MIGVFDSGHGGLTVFRALTARFPRLPFVYLGDHANVPYGDRPSDEVVALTRGGVEALFRRGCKLVLLGCNTATCVAARTLQQSWLAVSDISATPPGALPRTTEGMLCAARLPSTLPTITVTRSAARV